MLSKWALYFSLRNLYVKNGRHKSAGHYSGKQNNQEKVK